MNLFDSMHIKRGITSIIGSGGKTSLLSCLADEAPGTVALATTTHIFPLPDRALVTSADEDLMRSMRDRFRVVCVGTPAKMGKLSQPAIPLERMAEIFDFVFVEADGSKQLPLKAHAEWEPVVPPDSNLTILVVGEAGIGGQVDEVVHRPELFCERASCSLSDRATPELVARVIFAERSLGLIAPDMIFVNASDGTQSTELVSSLMSQNGDVLIVTDKLLRPRQQPLEDL